MLINKTSKGMETLPKLTFTNETERHYQGNN